MGVAGYRLYKNGDLIGTTQSLSHTFLLLTCGTLYTLGVEAFDAAGNTSGRVTLDAATPECPDVTPPTPPGRLRIISATETAVQLAWDPATDAVGVTGYFVYRDDLLVEATPALGITLTLQCGTQFVLAVAARDAAGNFSTRATVTATTSVCSDQTPPSIPTGLKVAEAKPTSITLEWEPSNDDVGVTGYRVERDGQLVETVPDAASTVTGLVCAKQYTFTVRARDAAGNLSAPATLTASTAECPDESPPTRAPGPAHDRVDPDHHRAGMGTVLRRPRGHRLPPLQRRLARGVQRGRERHPHRTRVRHVLRPRRRRARQGRECVHASDTEREDRRVRDRRRRTRRICSSPLKARTKRPARAVRRAPVSTAPSSSPSPEISSKSRRAVTARSRSSLRLAMRKAPMCSSGRRQARAWCSPTSPWVTAATTRRTGRPHHDPGHGPGRQRGRARCR